MITKQTQVIVIGGGPVGLSTALHLASHNIPSVLVERHSTTANHPKASYFNVRTMEILRELGIADDLYATGLMAQGVTFCTTLTGYKLGAIGGRDFPNYAKQVASSTASPGCISSQIVLEQILKTHADANPLIEVLFEHEKTALEQTLEGVRVTVRNISTGKDLAVDADYTIVCEGVRSATREAMGHEMLGPPAFGHVINIYIEADIESLIEAKNQALYWVSTPKAPGVFIGLGGDKRHWCFNTAYFPDEGESAEDFTEARCLELLYAAMGTDKLPIRILAVGPWVLCGQVIDRYRDGRIFFGGDTAHSNIPTGGFGFNTGMQETHNLAWKIAATLQGWGSDVLLDTYHQERRPIAEYNVEKSRENAVRIQATGATFASRIPGTDEIDADTPNGNEQRKAMSAAIADQKNHFLFLGQEIGFGYWDSPIVVPDGSAHYVDAHDIEDPVFEYVANARPGARAPHCWVATATQPDTRIPIGDLFGHTFVLLIDGHNAGLEDAVRKRPSHIPLRGFSVGPADSGRDLIDLEGAWRSRYELEDGGAVLVRPDGHVCWRAATAEGATDTELERALAVATGSATLSS